MSEDMTWLKSFVDERIAASHRETSAAPNTAHGAVVVDRFGHVVSGMAGAGGGGSSPQYGNGDISAGTSYSSASYTLLSYSPTGFTTGVYTAPVTGKYHYALYFRAGSASWTAGDELRIYEDINGSAQIIKLYVQPATRSMFVDVNPCNIVSLSAGDALSWYIYQTRSGGAITVDLTFVSILGFA